MRTLNPLRWYRLLTRRRRTAAARGQRRLIARVAVGEPTVYADAPLARVLMAVERRASNLEQALASYARARRAAGVKPESVIIEFKGVMRRAMGLDENSAELTRRLIDLYFAA